VLRLRRKERNGSLRLFVASVAAPLQRPRFVPSEQHRTAPPSRFGGSATEVGACFEADDDAVAPGRGRCRRRASHRLLVSARGRTLIS
jgi:hypothetical protein